MAPNAMTPKARLTPSVHRAPSVANSTPPNAGPATVPACQVELRHVAAFGYNARGTTSATSALRETCRKLRASPQAPKTR